MERQTKAFTLESLRSDHRLQYSSNEEEFRELAIDVPGIGLDVSFVVNVAVRVACSFLSNCRIQFSVFNPRFASEVNQPYLEPAFSIRILITVNC